MHLRRLSIAVFLATAVAAFAESRAPALSAADCDLLHSEYGVTAPGCRVAAPVAEAAPALRITEKIVTTPLPELSEETRADHVFFPRGGSGLDDAARVQLVGLIALLNRPVLRDACLRLVGHSDSFGAPAANLELSEKRATTVAAFLSAALGTMRIAETEGAGSGQPLKDFPTDATENRRVAIYLGPCAAARAP